MVRIETRFGWYWKRGKKILGPLSHRELRLLAEFGHLRPDDSLWQPGLASWTPPSRVRGVLPLCDSHRKHWDLTGIGVLLLAGSNELRRFTASSRQRARFLRVGLQRAYDRMVARWPHLDLIELVCYRPQQGIVAGLLVIAVLLGAVDVAMKSSSARGSKTQLTKSVVRKFQDRRPAEFAASAPLSTNPLEPNPPPDLTAAEVFNVSNGHPRGGLIRVPKKNLEAETAAQMHRPTPIFQSETAAGTESVPLPTKKPVRSFAKEAQPKTATSRRVVQGPQEPKPTQFGIIGYNYNPQR
jgi:GYF domain 2